MSVGLSCLCHVDPFWEPRLLWFLAWNLARMYAATAKQFLVRGRKVTGCRKRGGLLVVLMTEPTDFEGFCRLCSMLVFFPCRHLNPRHQCYQLRKVASNDQMNKCARFKWVAPQRHPCQQIRPYIFRDYSPWSLNEALFSALFPQGCPWIPMTVGCFIILCANSIYGFLKIQLVL